MKVWDVSVPTFRPCKVYDDTGAEVPAVFRVEFDGDGDEGMATVGRYESKMDADGSLVIVVKYAELPFDEDGNGIAPDGRKVPPQPSVITERRWVRVVPDVFGPSPLAASYPVYALGKEMGAFTESPAYGAVGELVPILRMETDAEMRQPNPFRRAYDAYLEGDRAQLGKDLSRWASDQFGVPVRVAVGEPEADTPTEVPS